ncbi:MAG: hypothetical protein ACLFTT_04845 [Candidatus Hydrogenedentota bacterium]
MRHIPLAFNVCALLALTMTTGVLAGPAQAVEAQPGRLVFEARSDTERITLTHENNPVPANKVTGWTLRVNEHDYDYMIESTVKDGEIVFTGTDNLEVGVYDLVINTAWGKTTVVVDAPLTAKPNILEERARERGITLQALKEELGFTTELPPEVASLGVADEYYEGQALHMEMPKQPGHTYIWSVNGRIVAQGPDANVLRYVFTDVGPHVITFAEKRDGETIATAEATTTVVPLPVVHWQVKEGSEAKFQAPPGYAAYEWLVNGEPAGEGQAFSHTFTEPGQYMVEIIAKERTRGADDAYYRSRYLTTVQSR